MQVVYLLLGSEQGLKEAYLKELLVKMDAFKSKVLVTKIFLSELSVVEFVEKLFSNSFFSEKEIFIVYESELLKAGKDLELVCNAILKSSNKTIIFVSNSNTCNIDFKSKLKFIKKVFYEIPDDDKFTFVKRNFFNLNIKITDSAINLMLLMLNSDTKILKFYIDSFALFAKNNIIDEEDITSWISFVRFENTFSLFNSILKKDMEHSLIKIKSILDQGEDFLSVLMSLIWQFKRFLKVQIDYSTCGSLQSALNKNKIFFSLNKIYRVGVKNYSIEEIKIVLKILYKFDLYLRIYSKNIHQNLSYFLIFSILNFNNNFLIDCPKESKFNF
ncbi:DNA polymerase III subunit delta [Borreliella garinii]|uniref:DNA polymerase III subunit delta n=1 Tax=Borreliella garinii TaxID=29519 RepID=UPI000517E75F|nr:DNA polymerase III subunit delta [Borreliella garinii]WNZ66669.1 DNA polymerase III subunit delta [Borreliella garinii]WNZ67664.1 DNA polymerase III subunit delta [Borreliella garinii]WNZ68662.1 DNA polymerase III subunit delta [Borreliella garinii]WNZ70033.1 DNA polymerase III subunit delta [Borreliella garinii]WNZ70660.1 DNA polymerase III subunit delta [Borreliella garinii]